MKLYYLSCRTTVTHLDTVSGPGVDGTGIQNADFRGSFHNGCSITLHYNRSSIHVDKGTKIMDIHLTLFFL